MTDDRDVKTMTIYFPIPAVADKYLTRPISYIGHLLGHESGGSILSALKERAWANGLSAGIHLTNYDFACVGVTVELSDQGVDHVQEIGSCVFAYLYMMGQKGPQEWVWKELQDTEEMNFRFINKVEPSDYATSLANGMHLYSIPHTVSGANLLYQMDLAQIEEYRSYLRPENSFIVVSHRGFAGKTALKEHWYGTEHNNRAYDAESELAAWQKAFTQESEWSAVLDLPQPNPFIPTEFDLKPPLAPVVSSKEDPTEAAAASGGKGTGREYPRLAERKLDVADVLQSMVQQPRVEEPDVPPTPPGEEEQEEEEEVVPVCSGDDDDPTRLRAAGEDEEKKGESNLLNHSSSSILAQSIIAAKTTTTTTSGVTYSRSTIPQDRFHEEFVSTSSSISINTSTSSTNRTAMSNHDNDTVTSSCSFTNSAADDPSCVYNENSGRFRISRIPLHGAPCFHKRYWDTVVLPRLRLFRDAVVAVRSDDELRYAFLLATPEKKTQILQKLCPYLLDD
mmetsp:Transcript_15999/g.26953  ORF Transcript_15999/g.26953 Transcript_15999/m.26953 type:complete len:508 (-) Transcript_15999:135-1658(-)